MSRRARIGVAATLVIAATAASGCVRFHGPEGLRRDLARTTGVRLERETGVTVTRSGMWLARWGLRVSGEGEHEAMLDGIRRVEVGVYRVVGSRGGSGEPLAAASALDGWTPVVRIRDEGDDALVLVQQSGSRIRSLLVVAADGEEWAIVRLRGRLDRVLERAMTLAFDEIDRPDLGRRALEERAEPAG